MAPEYYSVETLLISIISFVYENTVISAAFIIGNLKEDATVDIPTTLTPTQLSLLWMLMGLLLTWMLVFTLLALKPESRKKSDLEIPDWSTHAFPQLHIIVQPQAEHPAAETSLESTIPSTSNITR